MIALLLTLALSGEPTVIPASEAARIADGDHSAKFNSLIRAAANQGSHAIEVCPDDALYGVMNTMTKASLVAAGYKVERVAKQHNGILPTTYYVYIIDWWKYPAAP